MEILRPILGIIGRPAIPGSDIQICIFPRAKTDPPRLVVGEFRLRDGQNGLGS